MTSPYDESIEALPDQAVDTVENIDPQGTVESQGRPEDALILAEMAEATRMIRQIDSKLNALNRDFSPIAAQAAQTIDSRFKRAMDPLLRCIDTVRQLQSETEGEDDMRLTIVANELEGVLDGLNLERFQDEHFDPSRQRVIEQRGTTDRNLHGTVAASRYDGYRIGTTIVRPQGVVIYKYKETA